MLLLPKTLLFHHLCKHKPSFSSVLTHTLKMQISLSISTSNIPYFLPPQEPTSEFLSTKYPFSPFRRGVVGVVGGGGGQKNSVGGNHGGRVGGGGALFSLKGSGFLSAVDRVIEEEEYRKAREQVHRKGMDLEGYMIEGCSIGGHETCIVIPRLNCAFDIGRCPTRAIHQDFLFITHAHLDHIGGLPMYVATRGLYSLKPPTIFVPSCIKEDVEKLFEIHRKMSHVDLQLDLVALEVGDTYEIRNDLVVRPFQTNHVIPSQGYVVYSVRRKLKKQYIHLKGKQIEKLKFSGVEITDTILAPEVAFTGDTTAEFLLNPRSADALRAKVLITEATFLDEAMSIKHAREHGHTHLYELMEHAEWIRNKAIMLTHFSSRYKLEDIREAVIKLQSKVSGKVVALTEGFKPINP